MATIRTQLSHPDKRGDVLKALISLVERDAKVQSHLSRYGFLFDNLSTSEVETVKAALDTLGVSSYHIFVDQVRILQSTLKELFQVLIALLRNNAEVAKILWMKGLIIERLSDSQAADFKKLLESRSATVTVSQDSPPKVYRLFGQVTDQEMGEEMVGMRIDASFQAVNQTLLSQSTITDTKGGYAFQFDDTLFTNLSLTDTVNVAFQVHLGNQPLEITTDAVLQDLQPSDRPFDITVQLTQPKDDVFVVKGTIRQANGSPLIGATVCAFDNDMRHRQLLGEKQTNFAAFYEIPYTPSQFRRAEKKSADLSVCVIDSNNTLLVESNIIFNAQPVEIVDLMVGGGQYQGSSEYELLVLELTPLVENVPFAEVVQADINFLVPETGIEPQRIFFLAEAARLSQKTNISAEAFYGFARQNLPITLAGLLIQENEVLKRALEDAVDQNIIPLALRSRIEQIIRDLKQQTVNYAFESPEVEGTYSLGDLLNTVNSGNLDRPRQEKFLNLYLQHDGAIETFWQNLQQDPDFAQNNTVESLQVAIQLGALTQNHIPLVQHLQTLRQNGEFQTLRDLARWDENDWAAQINQPVNGQPIGTPPNIPGKDNLEKVQNYGKILSLIIEDAAPMAVITERLRRANRPEQADLVTFLDRNPGFTFGQTYIDDYLTKHANTALVGINNREAVITQLKKRDRVSKLLRQPSKMEVLIEDGLDSAQKINRMGQQMFINKYGASLGGQIQAQQTYEKAGLVSATTMLLYSQFGAAFNQIQTTALPENAPQAVEGIPNWESLFGSLDFCECDHCRSVYSPAAYFVDCLHWLSDRKVISEIERDSSGRILDVLYQLNEDGTSRSAKNALFERRPDLGDIELSCENTNTPVPYIDLVNEILENAVAPPPLFPKGGFGIDATLRTTLDNRIISESLRNAFAPNALSESATIVIVHKGLEWRILDTSFAYTIRDKDAALQVTARSLQTYGTPQELRANPQYINPAAYEVLHTAVYPWNLPFALSIEEVRTYLNHLGVPRYELMTAFLGMPETVEPISETAIAIATEHLGLTSVERQIITETLPETARKDPWEFWGLQENENPIPPPDGSNSAQRLNWRFFLENVRRFLDRSGLSYVELLDLLNTRFINPNGGIQIQALSHDPVTGSLLDPTICDTTKLKLLDQFDSDNALTSETWNRIHYFVRLWRKLGWSIRELDQAITVLQPTISDINQRLTDRFIARLSQIQTLQSQLKLSVDQILALWTTIDTSRYGNEPSLYEQLFQNPTVIKPIAPQLRLNDAGNELALVDSSIPNEDKAIARPEYKPTILAALKLNESALSALIDSELGEDKQLTLENLSKLYRVTLLTKGMRLSIQDTLSLKALSGINPFDIAHPEDTLRFIELAHKVKASGFSITELNYLLRHQFTEQSGIAPTEETIALILNDIRSGLQQIAQENTFTDSTVDTTGDLTRKKLALLNWNEALIEEAITALNHPSTSSTTGVDEKIAFVRNRMRAFKLPTFSALLVFDVDLAVLPPEVVFPNDLKERIAYDATTGKLRFTGLMTANERTKLRALARDNELYQTAISGLYVEITIPEDLKQRFYYDASDQALQFVGWMTETEQDQLLELSDHAVYQRAIASLYTAPNTFVPAENNQFLTAEDATQLFDSARSTGDRFNYILQKLLPHLRQILSENLVVQKLSEALKLETQTSEQLLKQWIRSSTGSNRPAIHDFLYPNFAGSQPLVKITKNAGSPKDVRIRKKKLTQLLYVNCSACLSYL